MNVIRALEEKQMKKNIPNFRPGDTVKVYLKIVEGDKERIQVFEGVVIGRSGSGLRETFIVRRISYGIGVERQFFVHSPRVEKIELIKKGEVRRAKLYYLREKSRKEARIREEKIKEEIISSPVVQSEAVVEKKEAI